MEEVKGVVCTMCGVVNILSVALAASEMTRLICMQQVGLVCF